MSKASIRDAELNMAKLDLIQEEETVWTGSNKKKAQPVDEPKIAALQQKHIPEDTEFDIDLSYIKKEALRIFDKVEKGKTRGFSKEI